jgi:beta-lactam-binding protein with PASTA domain
MPRDKAVKAIQAAGLVAKVVYVDADEDREGLVISQTPIGDKVVERGSTVTIQVGRRQGGPARPAARRGA